MQIDIGIIGLGRMGFSIALRLLNAGFRVVAYDCDPVNRSKADQAGALIASSAVDLARKTQIIWLMIPAGKIIDDVLLEMDEALSAQHIIVDGGNSNFHDSQRRYAELQKKDVSFVDCGTSGGVHGKEKGFCLMAGGSRSAFGVLEPFFKAIAAPEGYAHVGPSGAGHYVKMVHNGIEYALLQAYAEGLHLIHDGSFESEQLDLAAITKLWNHGSIIRSWILDLTYALLQKHGQDLETISGAIAESGTGKWTVEDAGQHEVPVKLIEESLRIRFESQTNGGNYATKLVALMRNEFGGHAYGTNEEK